MSKLIKWSVLVVLAIALLIKVSLWWSVRSIMNDAIFRLSPFMTISYAGITSSLQGKVGLERLAVQVPQVGDTLTIEHAELKFKSLGELLRFKESLAQGVLPQQLALSLKGLALQVHGPFMQQLYSPPEQRSLFTAMSDVACGNVNRIGTAQLLEMGYRTFESDMELSYRFLPGAQQLILDLTDNTRDVGEVRLALELSNMSDKPGDLIANPPRVSHVALELNENAYQRKVQAYCAAKLGQTPDAYRQTAVEHFDQTLRSQRVALDPSLLKVYSDYLQEPRSLHLALTPSESVAWDGLVFYEPKDVLSMLGPTLVVNGKTIEPLRFAWVDTTPGKVYGATEMVAAEPPQEDTTRASSRYEFVQANNLAQYVGKRLQFMTYDGTYYQGILRKIQNGKAFISVQFGTGSAEMNLRLDKINKARVML